MNTFTLNLDRAVTLTHEQFYAICEDNPDLKFERNAKGELIIMAPAGGETSKRNSGLNAQLWLWNENSKSGVVFDSSGGFTLPNGADRSPDLAWIPIDRWNALSADEKSKFLPLCPNFVVELLSPSDSWSKAQAKMVEYRSNGADLGWLIDPKMKRVEIYRQGQPVELLQSPLTLSGEDVLPGFILNLDRIWN